MTSACVVTSSAVVGSSARSRGRIRSERAGDHDALQKPSGELVWVRGEAFLSVRDAHVGEQL